VVEHKPGANGGASSPEIPDIIAQTVHPSRQSLIWKIAALGALVFAGALVVFYFLPQFPHLSASDKGPIRSIAVLPLEDLSGDVGQKYFADGITEAITGDLAQVGALRVISRSSAMQYRGSRKAVPQIGKELHVDGIVEGTIARSGDRVRVTAELLDARTDTHVWAHSYDRDLRDILNLQSELAADIAEHVAAELTSEQRRALGQKPAVDPVAHEAYLKGRFVWNERTEPGYLEAIRYFEQAINRQPSYAAAYAGLANAYALLGSMGARSISRREAMEKARVNATRALDLDPSSAEAHTSLAFVLMHYDWNLQAAEKEFRSALQLNPSYATAHEWHAYNLMAAGRTQESLAEIAAAQDLDPLSRVIITDHGELLLYARRYQDGIQQFRDALRLEPNFVLAHEMLTFCYLEAGQSAEALREAKRAVDLDASSVWALGALGAAYAASGERAKAQAILATLDSGHHGSNVTLAVVATELGERGRALQFLERDYRDREGALLFMNVVPMWDSLRGDPRFDALVQRVGVNRALD
jgi:TolB-like protein/Tfp pilus assembly protein PilF